MGDLLVGKTRDDAIEQGHRRPDSCDRECRRPTERIRDNNTRASVSLTP
jgi:hypothetical protein